MIVTPFYDPYKSYEENYDEGPFGAFADVLRADFEESGDAGFDKVKTSSAEDRKILAEKLPVSQKHATWLGQELDLPFGIPAGPLLNARYCKAAFRMGFDVCVYKTVRTRAYDCHPAPNVLPLELKENELTMERAREVVVTKSNYTSPLSITNSFGVPSRAPEEWQPDMAAAVAAAKKGQILIGSFQGTKSSDGSLEKFIADYVNAAKLTKETGAPVLEANLSCPNEGSGNLVCFDVPTVIKIATAIKNAIGDTPLILKLAYFESESQLRELVKNVGGIVQGLASINTIPAKVETSSGEQALPGEGRAISGVCGSAIKWAGLDMVHRLRLLKEELGLDYSIIGVGGVMTAQDYVKFRENGADVVMSATGAMWNPFLAKEIRSQRTN